MSEKKPYSQKLSEPLNERPKDQYCPECRSTRLIRDYDTAEIVCTDCGLVMPQAMIDHGPEWRAFNEEQRAKRERVGAPTTYTIHDKGLSTQIDWRDRDVYGRSLSPDRKSEIYRLRRWQSRIRTSDSTERNLAYTLAEIQNISEKLGLPKSTWETASIIYRKALKENFIRGRSMLGIGGASIYLACRQCGIPRDVIEISREITMPGKDEKEVKKEITRNYRYLVKNLNDESTKHVKLVDRKKLISKISDKLFEKYENAGEVEKIANKIIKGASETKPPLTAGKSPTGIVSASIYIASTLAKGEGHGKTQKDIAKVAGVTEVTIRNRCKELMRELFIDVFV